MGPVAAARRRLEIVDRQGDLFDASEGSAEAREYDALERERKALEDQHPQIRKLNNRQDVDGYRAGQQGGATRYQGVRDARGRKKPAAAQVEDAAADVVEEAGNRGTGREPARRERQPRAAGARQRGRAAAARGDRAIGRASRRTRSRGRRYLEQTGIPGAARSTTQLALHALGVLVGLSIAYLLLSNADKKGGKSAIQVFANGITAGVKKIVAPVDPLAGASSSSSASSALAAPDVNPATNPLAAGPPRPQSLGGIGATALPAHPSRAGARAGTKIRLPAH